MPKIDFSIKENDLERIQEAIINFGDDAENAINECLANEVKNTLITSITNFIPVSKQNKKHAKSSNPLQGDVRNNLTLLIRTKPKFNYLYFPQNAEGQSRNDPPNNFMEKGINNEYDNVINTILDKLQRRMEEI